MSKIVYYKDSTEIFSIEEWGGICYYLVDKETYSDKTIKCVCSRNSKLDCDYEIHSEKNVVLVPLAIKNIINKCNTEIMLAKSISFRRFTYTSEQERGHAPVGDGNDIAVVQGTKYTGGYLRINELKTTVNINKYKVITSCMWGNGNAIFDTTGKVLGVTNIAIVRPMEVPKGSFIILKYFDSEEQCKSFISYMYTKTIAFLIYIGLVGATLTEEFWRFVPDPGPFDHIFTDAELYKKYNLTEEEIDIIESVIKERT